MRVYMATDHGGFELKKKLVEHLKSKNMNIEDLGNTKYDSGDDYPDFVVPLAEKVANDTNSFGIVLGRSGNGEAIVANKVKGIRAAICLNSKMALKARQDNNANVLALGADYINASEAKKIIDVFLETSFSEEEKHKRRIEKISSYEAS